MDWTFHQGELDYEDVQSLLALHVSAMQAYSSPEACHVLPASGLNDLAISFFTARADGRLACIGALKSIGPGLGEIKSMRVAPEFSGRGAGRGMLGHLIDEARCRGYTALMLETGSTEEFAAANRLYESAGFTERGPFGGYPVSAFTRFMQLTL